MIHAIEDGNVLDVENLFHVDRVNRDPLWWKPPERASLRERLNARVDREKAQKRVPKAPRG